MNDTLTVQGFLGRLNIRQMLAPLLIILILSMMVLPLPPFVLDVFFTFNIAISVMVLLVAMYTMKPLDFSIFPTVLLVTTLLRLSLNVASTRLSATDSGRAGQGKGIGQRIEPRTHGQIGIIGDVVGTTRVRLAQRRTHQGPGL